VRVMRGGRGVAFGKTKKKRDRPCQETYLANVCTMGGVGVDEKRGRPQAEGEEAVRSSSIGFRKDVFCVASGNKPKGVNEAMNSKVGQTEGIS